jgi:ribosome-binding protein aMBF1 (putative translation factor)
MPRHPITTARRGQGIALPVLAQRCDMAETDLAAIERGARWPTAVEAVRIARHLHLSLAEVLVDVIEAQERGGHLPRPSEAACARVGAA